MSESDFTKLNSVRRRVAMGVAGLSLLLAVVGVLPIFIFLIRQRRNRQERRGARVWSPGFSRPGVAMAWDVEREDGLGRRRPAA